MLKLAGRLDYMSYTELQQARVATAQRVFVRTAWKGHHDVKTEGLANVLCA